MNADEVEWKRVDSDIENLLNYLLLLHRLRLDIEKAAANTAVVAAESDMMTMIVDALMDSLIADEAEVLLHIVEMNAFEDENDAKVENENENENERELVQSYELERSEALNERKQMIEDDEDVEVEKKRRK